MALQASPPGESRGAQREGQGDCSEAKSCSAYATHALTMPLGPAFVLGTFGLLTAALSGWC